MPSKSKSKRTYYSKIMSATRKVNRLRADAVQAAKDTYNYTDEKVRQANAVRLKAVEAAKNAYAYADQKAREANALRLQTQAQLGEAYDYAQDKVQKVRKVGADTLDYMNEKKLQAAKQILLNNINSSQIVFLLSLNTPKKNNPDEAMKNLSKLIDLAGPI